MGTSRDNSHLLQRDTEGLSELPPPFSFYKDFFWMWTIFKVFIEFVTILFLFYVFVFWPQGMWDLSSLTRDRTCTPGIGR